MHKSTKNACTIVHGSRLELRDAPKGLSGRGEKRHAQGERVFAGVHDAGGGVGKAQLFYGNADPVCDEGLQLGRTQSPLLPHLGEAGAPSCLLFVGPWTRAKGDPRDDVDEFFRLDTTLTVELAEGVEVIGSVYNLLDQDIREPAPFPVTNDFPMPGRTFFVRLRYRF